MQHLSDTFVLHAACCLLLAALRVALPAQLAVYTNEPVLLYQFQKWSMCYVYGERPGVTPLTAVWYSLGTAAKAA